MNEDRLTGAAKNLGGKVEEGVGRATGELETQVRGKARQAEGQIEEFYGHAKETAANAAEAVRDRASEAEDFLRTTIEQRPYTAAAVALGIGYVIGRFARRDAFGAVTSPRRTRSSSASSPSTDDRRAIG